MSLPDDQPDAAVVRAERERRLATLLDDLDRELGAPSMNDYSWADKALGLQRAGRRDVKKTRVAN